MKKLSYNFSSQTTDCYFDTDFSYLENLVSREQAVIITDEHIHAAHKSKLEGWKVIVLPAGEAHKNQDTVNSVIEQLIGFKADRKTFVVGVGGGVITDLTGYAASVYMRGLPFGFVPTTVLAMVDAAIGGKNGIDVGVYKNLVGVIRQPKFLLYDMSFLKTLPQDEWVSGFAEVIKHSCIQDEVMFTELSEHDLKYYQDNEAALSDLISRNAAIKSEIVKRDEFEQGDRKLLNFGHTMGHAIENMYKLSHGEAISIGMVVASRLSEKLIGFNSTDKVAKTLAQYGLPIEKDFDKEKAFSILEMDKKKSNKDMNYVLLEKIGTGVVKPIPLTQLKQLLVN